MIILLLADNKMRVDAVYIDFAKAFDSVSLAERLLKARSYGFNSHLLDWLSSFLYDRVQCVYIISVQSTSSHKWCTSRFCSRSSALSNIHQ